MFDAKKKLSHLVTLNDGCCSGDITRYSGFIGDPDRCRYTFDNYLPDGWEQYDTEQDAWYFGVWVSKRDLAILTYAEGDVSVLVCADMAAYNRQLEKMNNFHGEGFVAKMIHANGEETVYRQDRRKFMIKEYSVLLELPLQVRMLPITALSQRAAIDAAVEKLHKSGLLDKLADVCGSLHDADAPGVRYVEPDYDGLGYAALVDEVGDENYEYSKWYKAAPGGIMCPSSNEITFSSKALLDAIYKAFGGELMEAQLSNTEILSYYTSVLTTGYGGWPGHEEEEGVMYVASLADDTFGLCDLRNVLDGVRERVDADIVLLSPAGALYKVVIVDFAHVDVSKVGRVYCMPLQPQGEKDAVQV